MWYKIATTNKLNINIPNYVYSILSDIKQIGGRALVVGGAVRDAILGKDPKDIDFEVYRVPYDQLNEILSKYGKADLVGQSFGVIKFVGPDGADFDFSLPRTDSKSGVKHKDFDVTVSSDLSPAEAAQRRDFTINAISYDPITYELIDPFNGQKDLQDKMLRHTSEAFSEDPLRVLRGLQFASRYGFDLAPETIELMKSIKDQYQHLPKERIEQEFKKLVTKGVEPGKAIQFLYDTEWSENFPEIHGLYHTPQDSEYHPEGWSFTIVPSDFFRASVAVAQPINMFSRQLILNSIADPTRGESRDITSNAKLQIKPGVFLGYLPRTNNTRISNFLFSPLIDSPTSFTPTKRFVSEFRFSAKQTSEIIGVMFKVPVSSMFSIMDPSINDSEIVNGIIKSVSVYVMNVLGSKQLSAKVKSHDISMQKHSSRLSSRNGDFSISSNIIDPKFSIINNDVVFYFYLSGVGNVDAYISNISDVSTHILVNIGDVAGHTAHVMNAAAEIADRENLNEEERQVLLYAALAHDFAKPKTTKVINKKGVDRITSHGHEEAGGPMAREFLQSIGVNGRIISQVVPLVENHLNHIHFSNSEKKDSFVKQLAERLYPSNIRMLNLLIEADHSGRPPLPKELPEQAHSLSEYAQQHDVYNQKHPDLLRGEDVIKYTGGQGGKLIGDVLREHRNMILNDNLRDRETALQWLNKRMQSASSLINGHDVLELGIKGPEIKNILEKSWNAQQNGEFTNREEALNWLRNQI